MLAVLDALPVEQIVVILGIGLGKTFILIVSVTLFNIALLDGWHSISSIVSRAYAIGFAGYYIG
ncbi:hypothetical protein DSL72_002630 [Monilinia vaccinii-corymbosi]|uniref:Uncharacterized protein n=1 Tax=Monilinia vaccinii-corymbosi TaxID=61207 RepID=A0A8A3PD79_9HELO|nr:hypothetical protein DSL72_002630 [Monilinia vaccinii-corymbosi]